MSAEFAGRLRAKLGLLRRAPDRDALGAAADAWVENGTAWAWVEPAGTGPPVAADARDAAPLWRLTLRPCDLRVGDRVEWGARTLTVRSIVADPALPDRITAIGEGER